MAIPSLTLPSSAALLPQGNIFAFEAKSSSSATTETDIYGNPVVILKEVKNANQQWSIGAAYVDGTVVQAVIAAYENHTTLTLADEIPITYSTIIAEYPSIERHKMTDGNLTYTVKLLLSRAPTAWSIPVVSLTGPRQFGR